MTDDLNGMNSTAAEEFDYSGDGIVKAEHEFTITGFEIEAKGNGTQHKLTYETPALGYPVKVGYWVEHSNPQAAKAGRGNLKRIAQAALGQPKMSAASIVGATLLATVSEDEAGFAKIEKFKPVAKTVEVGGI